MERYSRPLKIFISYSHKNIREKNELVKYLLQSGNQYEILSDDLLRPGEDWNAVLTNLRAEADVFLLLVTNDYLTSTKVPIDLEQIMKRSEAGEAYVVPVILSDSDWTQAAFSKFQAVPKFGQPVNSFTNKEEAYEQINNALLSLYYLLLNKKAIEIIRRFNRDTAATSLNLANCQLQQIPLDLINLDKVEKLELQNNDIRKIENLDRLVNLTYLDLSNNAIETIEGLENLEALEHLDLERNRLTEIKNLNNNKKLKTLGLSTNNIEELSGIDHLQQLETFYAARNKISNVDALAALTALKRIVLTDNPIVSIRSLLPLIELGLRVQLKYALKEGEPGIFIKGCPIADPPIEVISMGTQAIIEHFSKVKQHGDKKLEIIKLILVGNSGVGKTNFCELIQKKKVTKHHVSTDTLNIQAWRAPFLKSEEGNAMMVNIFDFGGQDYYHDLHRLYYSHDTAYVLLWDTKTNQYAERKENLNDNSELVYEDFPIEYWLESIQYNLYGKESFDFDRNTKETNKPANSNAAPEQIKEVTAEDAVVKKDLSSTAPVLVLQNKIDEGEGLLNQVSLRAKYPNITTFYGISISEKRRTKIIYEILDSCMGKLNLSGRRLILYQHAIIEKYLKSKIEFEVLTLEAFKDKCAALNPEYKDILDISDAKIIASVLTNIGILYFYQPSKNETSGIVFTRIDELNNLIKKVMNVAKLGSNKGMLKYEQVAGLKYIDHILKLLAHNNSIIPVDNKSYLVPHFLPTNADTSVELFSMAFVHCQVRYVYTAYFHKSIVMALFARFLGRQNNRTNDTGLTKVIHYWRNGLILSQTKTNKLQMVFINFVKTETDCRIEIRTLYPFDRTGLEREIENELDELNKGWSFSKEVSVNSKDFFEVNAMIKQARDKNFIFQKEGRQFTVNDFKHLVNFENIPKKLFISYSSKNAEFIKRFWVHLDVLKSAGYIEPWYDRKIEVGTKWDDTILNEMKTSHLVIFLLSPDFLNTPYIMNVEVKKAMELEAAKECELFFIQLLPCGWEDTELKKYQLMLSPDVAEKKQVFVNTPGNDEAWKTILTVLKEKIKG